MELFLIPLPSVVPVIDMSYHFEFLVKPLLGPELRLRVPVTVSSVSRELKDQGVGPHTHRGLYFKV